MPESTDTLPDSQLIAQLIEQSKAQTELLEQILEVLTDMKNQGGSVMI